ncbi:recombinase family protein [Ochrobactrum sp. Marseille-Q0166]|uniref:recombinase family protein n=1 Tax=Ochrobactrum sp. Marseille-Q0166 TaxID=2761105 RepID=UPI001654FD24|nr:recombinase family protein [Ochrobactrum sp. Marseille-Q0166]MBC8716393.1 recombinase family protein [Ochrobactrum sp. Marseille-Q0166]
MIVGYARVSTEEQKLDLQLRALRDSGCNRIYQDHGCSGRSFQRRGLESALGSLKPGGTLVVWRLDRLGRSLSGLVQFIDQLGQRDANFKSVMENIDTNSSSGRLMFHMMGALAEFERSVISERTKAGLVEARARGRRLGRPKAITDDDVHRALNDIDRSCETMASIAERLGVSVRTLERHFVYARMAQ